MFRASSMGCFWMVSLPVLILLQVLEGGLCLNNEGRALLRFKEGVEIDPYGSLSNWVEVEGEDSPCSWNRVGCENGRIVSLNLESLFLKGTIRPDVGKLIYLKLLILHNNSFYGIIPKEIGELLNLKVLDLGYNNLSGLVPSEIGNLLFLKVLELRSNQHLCNPHELYVPCMITKLRLANDLLYSKGESALRSDNNATIRRLLQKTPRDGVVSRGAPSRQLSSGEDSSSALAPVHASASAPAPAPPTASSESPAAPSPHDHNSPPPSQLPSSQDKSKKATKKTLIIVLVIAGIALGLALICVLYFKRNKVIIVKPWVSGLSGQLQKAFVTGVPVLKRSELEVACEDFSNVIGNLANGILYKGTLSSGAEIAVSIFNTDKEWNKHLDAQFRKKISILSRVNHKNFMNLIGYCKEEAPLTRVMVFEYAPNGTLFEHLHLRGAQDLNWMARIRIATGIAYCLDHMHQLDPPVALKKLDSNSIYLTDDFAAKIADLELWSETTDGNRASGTSGPLTYQIPDQASIVHKFGIVLLELVTGRPPYSEENGGLMSWASEYFHGRKPLTDMIDPMLKSPRESVLAAICDVIRTCLNPEPRERPSMRDVATKLREITGLSPEAVAPKLSPLWWAELEVASSASA